MKAVADDLRQRMTTWMRETGDPALERMRTMDVPENVQVNDADDADPVAKFASNLTPAFCAKNEIPQERTPRR